MPDSRVSNDTPRDWSDAFAALPLEAPPVDAWNLIAAGRLLHRQPDARRRHRPYRFAMAAAIVLAMVVPMLPWIGRETPETPPTSSSAARAPVPATPSSTSTDATPVESTASRDEPQPVAPLSTPENSVSSPRRPAVAVAAAVAAKAVPRIDAGIDEGANARGSAPSEPRDPAVPATETATAEQLRQLENLYTESARLEAVLAQLQEPRVASATAATLSAELQDRIADIDGALSQSDMPSTSQLDLWQQRVDALRQLTGVETTQRWMAAQGTVTDGPLTQVY